jgi:hypothetical protein
VSLCFIIPRKGGSEVATKLKNLKIKKVDFVDEGANPDAHIRLLKSKNGGEQSVGENSEKGTGVLKRFFAVIGKAVGMGQDEIDSALEEIQKSDAVSFNEKFNEAKNRKIADEIWDICYALQSSLCSILNDEELDGTSAANAMSESLEEFHAVMQSSIQNWSDGKVSSIVKKSEEVSKEELEIMKSAVERLNQTIEKACGTKKPEEKSKDGPKENNENPKGDEEEMKIDKSKLTDAERAFLESIEKRCGTDDGAEATPPATQQQAETGDATGAVAKAMADLGLTGATGTQQQADDIYKGLHPAVKAEIEELKKFREAAEEKDLKDVAKRYTIIGKKEEELVPVLKSLKAAGGTAYDDMIAILDQTVATVEKSGAFTEIGKSGHGGAEEGSAEATISNIAKGYMEKDASMSYAMAMAKAWEDNPELVAKYEEEAGL